MRESNPNTRRNLGLVVGLVLVITLAAVAIFGPQGSEARHNNDGAKDIAPALRNAASTQQPQAPVKSSPTANETWTGGDNNDANWTSNDNWSGIGGASANDDLIFPSGAARMTNNNNFAVNTNFNSINFTGGAGSNYVISGNQIFLTNGISSSVSTGAGPIFNPNIILNANQTFSNSNILPLTLNGVVNLNSHALTVSPSPATVNIVMNGLINGTGTITKINPGTLIINSNSPGFGNVNLNAGVVQIGGAIGDLNLFGGTLQGTGTVGSIGGTGAQTATIAPGNGGNTTGILASTNFVSLSPQKTLAIDLNGIFSGTQYDRLQVIQGNVDLNGANLDVSLSFVPPVGQQFTIITQSNAGSITGQFAQGTAIVVNGQIFTITYSSSSVVLTAQGPTLTWDGGGADNKWSTAANWNPNVAPADGLDLVFPAGAPANRLVNNNDIAGLDLRSLTVSGNGYNIFGSAITLSKGIVANQPSGQFSELALAITLSTPAQTFSNTGGLIFVVSGDLNLNGFGLTVDGPGPLTLGGIISGSGGLTKNSTWRWFLPATTTTAARRQSIAVFCEY